MTEIGICEVCSREFFKKTPNQSVCSKECKKLNFSKKIKTKVDKWNDFIKIQDKKIKNDWKKTNEIKLSILKDMDLEGFHYCQECGKTQNNLELHHIIKRSECPNHPQKHCKQNSLLLCKECHGSFHKHNELRVKWLIERKLWKTFEFLKKENYEI